MHIKAPRWTKPFFQPYRYKGAKGGRGSGKSNFFAELCLFHMMKNPDTRIVCIREIQKSLKFSAKKLVEDKIEDYGLGEYFDITLSEIRRKGSRGVMIFQGMQDHTADSIKSLEGFNIAWVEEAQSISERSMELLLPTIRAEGSEIWFSWNPQNDTDPIEKFFAKQGDDKLLVHINYTDNPFLPQTLKDEAERHKREMPDSYNHVWLGEFIKQGAVFRSEMFRIAAVPDDIHVYAAVDIAMSLDADADRSAIAVIGVDTANNIYLLDIQAGRWSSHELKERILDVCMAYPLTLLGIEKTTASWHFVESFREIMRVRNVFVPFEELKPSGRAKQLRIEAYILSAIQQNRLYLSRNFDELIQEAVNFPNGKHDDLLDALSYSIEMAFSRPREGKAESISEYYYDITEGWL